MRLTSAGGNIYLVQHLLSSTTIRFKMCNPRTRSHLTPKYWHKLRKEAMANYFIDKTKMNVTRPTILVRRYYIRQNDADQTDALSSNKIANGLLKKYMRLRSTHTKGQANGSIHRNVAGSDILIRKDYDSKKN